MVTFGTALFSAGKAPTEVAAARAAVRMELHENMVALDEWIKD
jgi:hypothetical protein